MEPMAPPSSPTRPDRVLWTSFRYLSNQSRTACGIGILRLVACSMIWPIPSTGSNNAPCAPPFSTSAVLPPAVLTADLNKPTPGTASAATPAMRDRIPGRSFGAAV